MSDKMSLCIGIPTYNRSRKLGRTLRWFAQEIRRAKLERQVEILISDNASPDNSGEVVAGVKGEFPEVKITYFRHPENVGPPRNFLSLYLMTTAEYMWWFADDDVPYEGCVERILSTVKEHSPSVLVYTLVQPPGSKWRRFKFEEPVHLEHDVEKCMDLLLRDQKISIYVFRKKEFDESTMGRLHLVHKKAPLYGYLRLPVEVIAAFPELPVGVISDALAECDEDFVACMNWDPPDWKAEGLTFDHPYLKEKAPIFYENREKWVYRGLLVFFWNWRSGFIGMAEKVVPRWWAALREFPCKWGWVKGSLKATIMLTAIKIGPKRLPRLIARLSRMSRGETA